MKSIGEIKVQEILEGKKNNVVHFVKENETILEVSKKMKDLNVGLLIVKNDQNEVSGVVSERDVVRRAVVGEMDLDLPVKEIMTANPVYSYVSESIEDCLTKFKDYHCRHLPVGSPDNPLVTVLSERDVVYFLVQTLRQSNLELLGQLKL